MANAQPSDASHGAKTEPPHPSSKPVAELVLESIKDALPSLRQEIRSDLHQHIRAEVEAAVAAVREPPPLRDDHAWSVEEAHYFLGVSESEVRKLEREGRLPALPRYCNRLLFDPVTVRAFREGSLSVTALNSKAR